MLKKVARGGTLATLVGVMAMAAAVVVPSVAWADSGPVSTTGASASFKSYGDSFTIKDTACDSHSVYVEYQGPSSGRIDNGGGCGSVLHVRRNQPENQSIRYRACVNIQRDFDRCSSWQYDHS
ncbi:MAG: hypothetical protein ACRDSP_06780 [Pseudonocardiaceae bacterium]